MNKTNTRHVLRHPELVSGSHYQTIENLKALHSLLLMYHFFWLAKEIVPKENQPQCKIPNFFIR